jgi:hypothetical protein
MHVPSCFYSSHQREQQTLLLCWLTKIYGSSSRQACCYAIHACTVC